MLGGAGRAVRAVGDLFFWQSVTSVEPAHQLCFLRR
ncbi:hypothetical protein LCGC14_2906450, partial [marine sediment metagenome]